MALFLLAIALLVLLFLSAFFAGSETALMVVSKLRLRVMAESKPRRVKIIEGVLAKPEKLIGTILLGNNLVNIAMSAIATALAISIWGNRGIVYVTAVLTIVILIFADITPKIYSKYYNEPVSLWTAPIMKFLVFILGPFVWLATSVSNLLLRLLGIDVRKMKKPLMTESEIRMCIKMGWDDGTITEDERKMLARVFTLNDKKVGEVMVPKDKMVTIAEDSGLKQAIDTIMHKGMTRIPVTGTEKDEIVGILHAKDLFRHIEEGDKFSLKKILRPPIYTSFERKIDSQLKDFQSKRLHQAIVLDAEGKAAGLVTLEDIIEELVGNIEDEHDVA
ncbi:MAG: DUF21 domain-containing protein [Planctomycetota bacterium]|nr:MAG: DUF21 domain-containing protein [Planctomycetota bacterium]